MGFHGIKYPNSGGLWLGKSSTGWCFEPTPLKNDGVKVSWDYDIPNMMGKIKNIPNHQSEYDINGGCSIAMFDYWVMSPAV